MEMKYYIGIREKVIHSTQVEIRPESIKWTSYPNRLFVGRFFGRWYDSFTSFQKDVSNRGAELIPTL